MITNITLENFKCFRKVEINPKLVTLFIGPNGTGKSGVFQALLLLKQSEDAGERLDLNGPLVNVSSEDLALESPGPQSAALQMFDALPSPDQQTTTVHLSLRGKPFHNVSSKRPPLWGEFTADFWYSVDGSRLHDEYGFGFPTTQDFEQLAEVTRQLRTVPAERGLVKGIICA